MAIDSASIDHLILAFHELRAAYEQYIAGNERREPSQARERFKKELRRLQTEATFNTAARFRLTTLQASFVTYETHWARVAQHIEDGTFVRDKIKAQKKMAADTVHMPAAAASAANPGGQAAATTTTPALLALHRAYEAARPAGSKGVSLAALSQAVATQTKAIKARYGCKEVTFRVDVKDGKPVLKAIPR